MARIKRICKNCGAEYICCNRTSENDGMFHWKDVACSLECGLKYVAEVEAERAKNRVKTQCVEDIVDTTVNSIEDQDFSFQTTATCDTFVTATYEE